MATKKAKTIENSTATINDEEVVVVSDNTDTSDCGHHSEDGTCTCQPGHCSVESCINYWVEETNSEGKKGKHHYATTTTDEKWELEDDTEDPDPTPDPDPDPTPNPDDNKDDNGDGKDDNNDGDDSNDGDSSDCPNELTELVDELRVHAGVVIAKDIFEGVKAMEDEDAKKRAINQIKGYILSYREAIGGEHVDSVVKKIDSYFA